MTTSILNHLSRMHDEVSESTETVLAILNSLNTEQNLEELPYPQQMAILLHLQNQIAKQYRKFDRRYSALRDNALIIDEHERRHGQRPTLS